MVAYEKDDRDTCIGQAFDTAGKLASVGRIGIAILVGVSREKHQVDLVLEGIVYDIGQPPQEIHDAAVQSSGGIDPTIVLHADVNVGQVQDTDLFHDE
jgi:hypothetical protein